MLIIPFYNVSSYFSWLLYDLYFLIPAIIAHIFNHIPELAIPIGIPSKEAKAEIEKHPGTADAKTSKCSVYNSELCKPFYAYYSLIDFVLFLQQNNVSSIFFSLGSWLTFSFDMF